MTGSGGRDQGSGALKKSGISSFRDLKVWQTAMALAEEAYAITAAFPGKEMYGLSQQIQRASVSIPSNIAEGHARDSSREYLHHLSIAIGSLAELETQLELAARLHYLDEIRLKAVLQNAAVTGMMLRALQRAMKNRLRSTTR
jgi:four helix bundle protein